MFPLILGSTLLYKTNKLEQYGTLGQDTSLTCEEVTITPATTYFDFKKDKRSFILHGDITQPTKYIVTINDGSIVLIIKNTSTSDEGNYTCSIDFVPVSSPYNLKVEG